MSEVFQGNLRRFKRKAYMHYHIIGVMVENCIAYELCGASKGLIKFECAYYSSQDVNLTIIRLLYKKGLVLVTARKYI